MGDKGRYSVAVVKEYGESGTFVVVVAVVAVVFPLPFVLLLSLLLLLLLLSPDSCLRFFFDAGSWLFCLRLRSGSSVTTGGVDAPIGESTSIASIAIMRVVLGVFCFDEAVEVESRKLFFFFLAGQ